MIGRHYICILWSYGSQTWSRSATTVWPAEWTQFVKPEVEELDKTLSNLRCSKEYHWRSTKESTSPLLSWSSNPRNFWNPFWHYYKTTQEKLNAYFSPKKNVHYEIFWFRQAVQQPDETVDQFATRLRKIATNCEFHDVDKEIKAAIIQNCQSKRLQQYALRQDALTL